MNRLIIWADRSIWIQEPIAKFIKKSLDNLLGKCKCAEIIMEGGVHCSYANVHIQNWTGHHFFTWRIHHNFELDPIEREANGAIVFWDGKNKETKRKIKRWEKQLKKVKVIRYEKLIDRSRDQIFIKRRRRDANAHYCRRRRRDRGEEGTPSTYRADELPF